jgi:hypothetical protein
VPWGTSSTSSSPDRYCRAKLFVLTHIGTGDSADAARGEENAEAAVVDAAVVGDDLQTAGAVRVQGADEGFGYATESEAADGQRGAVGYVGDRFSGARSDLAHAKESFQGLVPGRTAEQSPSTTRLAPVMRAAPA